MKVARSVRALLKEIVVQVFQIVGRGWGASVTAETKREAVRMFSNNEMFAVRHFGPAASGVKEGVYSYSGNVPWRSNK